MPENLMPGPVCDLSSVRESVCVHTRKIFDSCRDKDCVEDLRFYPTTAAQEVLSTSQMIKGGTAELLYIYTDVEPVTFNRGFYSIDMRFFYRVTLQVCTGTPRYAEAEGLCVFDKRCILFGRPRSRRTSRLTRRLWRLSTISRSRASSHTKNLRRTRKSPLPRQRRR